MKPKKKTIQNAKEKHVKHQTIYNRNKIDKPTNLAIFIQQFPFAYKFILIVYIKICGIGAV